MSKYSISARSAKLLETLTPYAKQIMTEMLQAAHAVDLNMQIHSAYRSPAEQDGIFAQGRTKPGKIATNARGTPQAQSMHCYKVAVDAHFDQNQDGMAEWDEKLYKKVWEECLKKGLDKRGLAWAGNWQSFKETAHFEVSFGKSWRDFAAGFDPSKHVEPVKVEAPKPAPAKAAKPASKVVSKDGMCVVEEKK
jgi:peptidoglycan LD-endopeptidase CwlK